MRKSNSQPIKSVIHEYIEAIGKRRKLNEVKIISGWEKLMGKPIANHTKGLYIKKGILFVKIDSAALRNELIMHREGIVKHINEYAGTIVIEKVIIN